jgi:hypothetical protein
VAVPQNINVLSGLAGNHKNESAGPFLDSSGNHYIFLDDGTTDCYKVADPTTGSFAQQDAANAPADEFAGFGAIDVGGDTLFVAGQNTSGTVRINQFRTSGHASADTWQASANTTLDALSPPPGSANQYFIGVAQPADGETVIFYTGDKSGTMHADPEQVFAARYNGSGDRKTAGNWTVAIQVNQDQTVNYYGGAAVEETTGNDVQLAYYDSDGEGWTRKLQADNTLTTAVSGTTAVGTSTLGNVGWAVAYDDGGVEVLMVGYRDSTGDGASWSLRDNVSSTTNQVIEDANNLDLDASGDHGIFSAAVEPGTQSVWCVFVDDTTLDLHYDENADEAGWGTDTTIITGTVQAVSCSIFTRGGDTILGMLGQLSTGAIDVTYTEVTLATGAAEQEPALVGGKLVFNSILGRHLVHG